MQNIYANTLQSVFQTLFAETSAGLKCTFPPVFSATERDFSHVFFSACKLRNRCPRMLCFHSEPRRDGLACLKHFTRSRSVDCCVTLHKGLPVLTALLTLVSEPQCCVTLHSKPGRLPRGCPAMRTGNNDNSSFVQTCRPSCGGCVLASSYLGIHEVPNSINMDQRSCAFLIFPCVTWRS